MKVESSEYPIHIEVLGNKKLVNFDVEELTTEDNGVSRVYYRYSQLKMHIADSDECITAAETKVRIAEAQKYLVDTAWYIERFNDPSSGKAIPQEILDGRAQARVTINELEVV